MAVNVSENGRAEFVCMGSGPPAPTFLVKKVKPVPGKFIYLFIYLFIYFHLFIYLFIYLSSFIAYSLASFINITKKPVGKVRWGQGRQISKA